MLHVVVKQLHELRANYNKLKEDFVYNLHILEERDKELQSYDATFSRLKTCESAQQAEISNLKVQLDQLEQLLVKERRKRAALHYRYQQNLGDNLELEQFCRAKNSHTNHQHEQRVSLRHCMDRKLQELQGELDCQKQTFQSDDKSYLREDIPGSEVQKLQEQNANLRAVIAQMRKEMESLDEQTPSSGPQREQSVHGHTAGISPVTAAVPMGRAEGSLCTDRVSGRTMLSNMNGSSGSSGCVGNPGTEKGSNNRVMDKEVMDFGSASANCCPGGGVQHGVCCTPQGTPNKLKEAVRTKSVLSQEKQQLIEMGNRLRTDLGMMLKEGLWHPTSPKLCTVCVGSGGLSPRELVRRTQCQLSALRHLQHQLITQELQFAKEQHLSRISSLIARPISMGEKAPSSCGEETEPLSAEVQLDSSAGNYGPKQQKATAASSEVPSQPPKDSPGQAQQVWISSPGAHSSCQVGVEITHSTEQPGEHQEQGSATGQPETHTAGLAVRGTKLEVQQKLKPRNPPCLYPIKRKIPPTVAKIRNYNIKD
ncbi:coiled-coil domain-containing protein 57 isoform X2 [Excalfactoria chinensis]|uniref:coiled-coil domain-containing protein 57 isoform X2 n=1 Tax=Excalfactoria chinensis TaxID=46218 RepID=UPI003B3B418F